MKISITCILLLMTFSCFGTSTKVTRVIDGDTFETDAGEKVRLLGINAPEITDIFGKEAKEHLSNLILNKIVELEIDKKSNDKDRYQRLLRYVILDGVDINFKMISDGYAFALLKYNFSRSNDYEQAQLLSRDANNGIWGNSKKETTINKQLMIKTLFIKYKTPKSYIVGALLLTLIFVGLYFYFRK